MQGRGGYTTPGDVDRTCEQPGGVALPLWCRLRTDASDFLVSALNQPWQITRCQFIEFVTSHSTDDGVLWKPFGMPQKVLNVYTMATRQGVQ